MRAPFKNLVALVALALLPACEQGESSRNGDRSKSAKETDGDAESADETNDNSTGKKKKPVKSGNDEEGEQGAGKLSAVNAKKISLPGSRGDQVPGYLWIPERTAGQKFPAVLMMYGIKGNKDDGTIHQAAEVLMAAGYVAVTIDWPGTGDRGNIGNQERIVNGDIRDWTVGDYQATYNYLQTLPEVDTGRMGYVGASMGAMTGLAFAAADQRVKAMVAIVPIPNPLWGANAPESTIGRLSPRPVLCISTNDNSDFSAMVCNRVGAGGTQKALAGGHELEGFQGQVIAEAKAFLDQHLKN